MDLPVILSTVGKHVLDAGMVSYQRFTAICYEVAKRKGVQFSGIQDGADFTSQIAQYWNENKAEIKPMTVKQATDLAEEIVER